MNVLVAVAEVVSIAEDFEIEDGRIPEAYREYDLNEWDDYAVEAAVRLAEDGPAEEVVAATIGPERVEETVRTALAKGADRAVRVWDDDLAGRDLLDAGTKAALLAAVVADEEPDLVLTGVQTGDDSWGATGVALAEAAGYAHAAVVNDFALDGDVARVRRELEGGVEELVDVELPAVLTIQTGINDPRYASLRGIRAAQSKEIDRRTPADLGVDVGAPPLTIASVDEPEAESETAYLEGSPEEQAAALADTLRELGVGAE